ncbi:MAG: ribosomal protein S18-alanine N-acetyltransferase [Salaquimonas sp.]
MFRLWPSSTIRFTIEKADRSDLQQCADIHATSFSRGWGDGELGAMLANKNTYCLVAKSERGKHEVLGFMIYSISAKEAEILTIATLPKTRKSGIGAGLLEEMIRRCLADRLDEIFLEVEAVNKVALQLYKKHGFVKVGERKGYYQTPQINSANEQGDCDALIMRLDLLD